jgi:hypothetical protein
MSRKDKCQYQLQIFFDTSTNKFAVSHSKAHICNHKYQRHLPREVVETVKDGKADGLTPKS